MSGGNAYDMAGRMNFWLLEFGRERLKIGGNTEIWAGNGSLESPNSRKWSDILRGKKFFWRATANLLMSYYRASASSHIYSGYAVDNR